MTLTLPPCSRLHTHLQRRSIRATQENVFPAAALLLKCQIRAPACGGGRTRVILCVGGEAEGGGGVLLSASSDSVFPPSWFLSFGL